MSSNIIFRVPVDDRKRFIPQNSTDLGLAGLLWKRYMGR